MMELTRLLGSPLNKLDLSNNGLQLLVLTAQERSRLILSATNTRETQVFRTFNHLRLAIRDLSGYDVRPQFPEHGIALTFIKGRTYTRSITHVWNLGSIKPTIGMRGPVKIVDCNFDLSDFYVQRGQKLNSSSS
jgi:hypothetical protein